ncbi:MAG: transposase [Chitinispirillales bacterium]|nr:transposase [Chitinispirillales bacterium]
MRLSGYDYSQAGSYFVTICTKNRKCLFGDVIANVGNGSKPFRVALNEFGKIAEHVWLDLSRHNEGIVSNIHQIMPNHIHGIFTIIENGGHDIPEIIRQVKTFTSRYINDYLKRNGLEPFPTGGIWQKSYHDHIIRNDESFQKIYRYIENNPVTWERDCFNPGTLAMRNGLEPFPTKSAMRDGLGSFLIGTEEV